MRFSEGDDPAGKLQQSEVIAGLLRPANEQRAVAVEPGVAGLHNPASGAPSRDVQLVFDLLASGADMGDKPVGADEFPGLLVVVGLVQADALRPIGGGPRPLYGEGIEGSFKELVVVAVGSGVG